MELILLSLTLFLITSRIELLNEFETKTPFEGVAKNYKISIIRFNLNFVYKLIAFQLISTHSDRSALYVRINHVDHIKIRLKSEFCHNI